MASIKICSVPDYESSHAGIKPEYVDVIGVTLALYYQDRDETLVRK